LAAANSGRNVLTGVLSTNADSAARRAMLASLVFAVIGAAATVLMLIKVSVPGLFDTASIAGYGRMRAIALNSFVYGFGGLASTGLAYYMTPRLAGAALARQRLANLGAAGHTFVVTIGLASIALGITDPLELAEFPLLVDLGLFSSMVIPALIVTATVRARTERTIYVSLWYVLAGVWWLPALYFVGNVPGTTGLGTQLQSSFMVGGLIGAWLPMVGIGAAYYVIPRATDRALFSRPLAQAGFWSLAGTGLFASVTRYGSGAAPDWLETTGTVFSLGLIVAAVATLANLAGTANGAYGEIRESTPLRMIGGGLVVYVAIAALLSVQGFRSIDAVVGLTSWYEGLILATVLAAAPLLLIGAMAYALPQIAGRRLVDGLAKRGISATLWGGSVTGLLLVISGLVTGLGWNTGAVPNSGEEYVRTTGLIDTYQLLAILSALVAAAGIAMLTLVILRTYTSGEAIASEVLVWVGEDDE